MHDPFQIIGDYGCWLADCIPFPYFFSPVLPMSRGSSVVIRVGNFGASGQSCVAGSRVFVQSGIHDEFVAEVVRRAEQIRIGDPLATETQMGPLATQAQRDRIESVVADSIAQGATLHLSLIHI